MYFVCLDEKEKRIQFLTIVISETLEMTEL